MGGQGSGRPPDMIKMARAQEAIKTIAPDEGFVLPNYSGLQAVKKTDTAVITTETDPVFMALSGSFLYESLSGSLPYIPTTDYGDFELSGSPTFTTMSGSIPTYLHQSLSGSLPYIPTTDYPDFELSGSPTFTTLSGSIPTYLHESLSGSLSYIPLTDYPDFELSGSPTFSTLSGSIPTYLHQSLSGSWNIDLTSGSTHFGDSSNPHGTLLTQTYLNTNSGSMVIDNDASGSAVFRNILIGTEASPGAASGWTQGTVYLQYTA